MPSVTTLGILWNKWLRFVVWLSDMASGKDHTRRDDGNSKALLIVFLAAAALAAPAGLASLLPADTSIWAASVFTGAWWLVELGVALLSGVRAQRLHAVQHASRPAESPGDRIRGAEHSSAGLSREVHSETAAQHARTQADVQAESPEVPGGQTDAVAGLVRAEMDRGLRHLDRMGWLFAAIGLMVAVLVVIVGPYIPVLKR